jgi:RNA polymerase sigma factor (TIGR02999 family)
MDPGPVTGILQDVERGNSSAVDSLTRLVYQELRRLAGRLMRTERPGHTLQPTALVHEAYVRLVDQGAVGWVGRAHFMALAARTMRRILVDHARRRGREKRGAGFRPVTLSEDLVGSREAPGTLELLALEEALDRLEEVAPRAAEVVELRLFGGLSHREAAGVLGVSEPTVKRDWRFARAWLSQLLLTGESDS